MKFDRLSRRHFLQGLGGTALALPLLPSLWSRAEAQGMRLPRFFVSTWVGHGGVSNENTYPIDATVTLRDQPLYAGHVAKTARLVDCKRTHAQTAGSRSQTLEDFDAGAARISPLIGSFLTDALLEKMNVLRGIDFLHWGGHTRGYLGNFVNRDGGSDNGLANVPVPTIDQVIAASNNFYTTGERALLKAPGLSSTWTHLSSARSGSGVAQNPYGARTVGELFNLLFNGVTTMPGQVDPRAALVDRVHGDYARLARGANGPGKRLSKDDRVRLEEYMTNLSSIGERMRAMQTSGCTVPTVTMAERALRSREGEADWEWTGAAATATQRVEDQRRSLELFNMLLVHAFSCGSTRIALRQIPALRDQWDPAIYNTPSTFEASRTDAHAMTFHNHFMEDRQRHMMRSQRFFFQYGFADLVARLEATQVVPGTTMLDQALVYWSSESGPSTHNAKSVPAILAGRAGGYFSTGNYIDYTNRARVIRARYGDMWYAGLPQNRLLANIAQAMGLTPAEYELSDAAYATKFPSRGGRVPGYGDPLVETGDNLVPYLPEVVNDMSTKLPVVTT
ncbi:MAG: DUF1552 domain-containing protein [Myxococcaceae bacterium]|nr:DUF1552 domain-containing protein [Myxococcaceae bacterium]